MRRICTRRAGASSRAEAQIVTHCEVYGNGPATAVCCYGERRVQNNFSAATPI